MKAIEAQLNTSHLKIRLHALQLSCDVLTADKVAVVHVLSVRVAAEEAAHTAACRTEHMQQQGVSDAVCESKYAMRALPTHKPRAS
jgi:intracellular sulfur oxidation DsrE/DsrF family protein